MMGSQIAPALHITEDTSRRSREHRAELLRFMKEVRKVIVDIKQIEENKILLLLLVLSIRNHFINYTFCIKMKSAILKNIALYAQTVFTWIMITFTHGVKEINGQKGKYLIDSVISLLLPQIKQQHWTRLFFQTTNIYHSRLITSSTCGSGGGAHLSGGLATAAAERSMLRTPASRYADTLMEMDEDDILA